MWDYLGFLVRLVRFPHDTWDIVGVALSILCKNHDDCMVLIVRWLSCRSTMCMSRHERSIFGVVRGISDVEERSEMIKF